MYLQCKAGFVEVDRWDGTPVPVPAQQAAIDRLRFQVGNPGVVVVRCRSRGDLRELLTGYGPARRRVWKSPPGWDYEYRAYLTLGEWAVTMANIAGDLDYRNFKSWCHASAPAHAPLAHRIWHAAAVVDPTAV
jgi:hypothetical protein